ncbi:hypothetical protein RRG08_022053 [Elysia crispata]|uniref:Endonuclease/exonuclease/phosphatase domain-containing protein n=1 Tax=Elysia crispata TaxID=231223 RepID=A0AAE0YXF2_9GAST|nr:hypothetical protein RRG08_022053 [Elysia crispata]
MTVQLTLGQCGVAPLVRGQDGAAPGPVPGRGPPFATDCDSLAMARGEQSRTTGHLLPIAHWNVEGVRQKKLEFEQFLQKHNIDICCLQETHLNGSFRFHIRLILGMKYFHHNSIDSNISTFTKSIIQAPKLSIPRGRRKHYKSYWNQRLEDLHKQLDTARDALEKQPIDFNRQIHK